MITRYLTTTAALAALAASPLYAQITHEHVASLAGSSGDGEIVAYDGASGRFFVSNPDTNSLDVFVYAAGALTLETTIALAGSPNGVDTYAGLVAVAVEGPAQTDAGVVQFFDAATGAASGVSVTVGAMPEMLVFTHDGATLLVANEGEADEATGLINPEGSVSIIDVAARTVATADFNAFDANKAAMQAIGVRLSDTNGVTLSQDLEPEYIAVNAAGTIAYVTCQENNCLARLDLTAGVFNALLPLGEKAHVAPGSGLDASNEDGIDGNIQSWPLRGYFMPDRVAMFTVGGAEYIAIANEGESRRGFAGFEDETRGADLEAAFNLDTEDTAPDTALYTSAQLADVAALGRLKFATSPYDIARGDTDGDGDVDQLYTFGGRSFSILSALNGSVVFESGDMIAQAMLANGLWNDERSDDKGAEPESLVFGEMRGVPYLFVALERTDAICVFDVSDPAAPVLTDVIDVAGESGTGAGDPEGMEFLPAASSPLGVDTLAVSSDDGGVLSLFSFRCSTGALTTTLASNTSAAGNMFDLRATNVPISLNCIDANLAAGLWDVEIYTTTDGGSHVGVENDPSAWTLLASLSGVAGAGVGVATSLPAILDVGVTCAAPRGFYVTCTNGQGLNYTAVSDAVGSVAASNGDLEVLNGTGNAYPFGSVYGPSDGARTFNGTMRYTVTSGVCAAVSAYGQGCPTEASSFYELYEPTGASPMDLAGRKVKVTRVGDRYRLSSAPVSVAPIASYAVRLPLGDDDVFDTAAVGGTFGLHVGSNGWVALGPGNAASPSPDVASALANPATALYAWTDLRPATAGGSLGDVWYEQHGTLATITFDQVAGAADGEPNTMQFTYDVQTCRFTVTFGTLGSAAAQTWLVAYSAGGATLDPGPTDVSSAFFTRPQLDILPLELRASVAEVGGALDLTAARVEGTAAFFFLGQGVIDPGFSLAFLGAPGCAIYTDASGGFIASTVAGGGSSLSLPIPNVPALMGAEVSAQATAATSASGVLFAASNGLLVRIGS